jgi:ComF family protein
MATEGHARRRTRLHRKLISALDSCFSSILPTRCLICGLVVREQLAFCKGCELDLPFNDMACARCAAAISHGELCGACLGSPPPFSFTFSPLRYGYPIDKLIQRLKYGEHPEIARALGRYLGAEIMATRSTPLPEALIPVPLHPDRLQQRGYNQALEISRPVAKITSRPLIIDLIHRTRDTSNQVGKTRDGRDRNVRGAFRTKEVPQFDHCAIVDDVMTSGATVRAISVALRNAGVKTIEVWTLARA